MCAMLGAVLGAVVVAAVVVVAVVMLAARLLVVPGFHCSGLVEDLRSSGCVENKGSCSTASFSVRFVVEV